MSQLLQETIGAIVLRSGLGRLSNWQSIAFPIGKRLAEPRRTLPQHWHSCLSISDRSTGVGPVAAGLGWAAFRELIAIRRWWSRVSAADCPGVVAGVSNLIWGSDHCVGEISLGAPGPAAGRHLGGRGCRVCDGRECPCGWLMPMWHAFCLPQVGQTRMPF